MFRYRINILKQFAKQELTKLKSRITSFYKEIENLIAYTEKTELAAMQQLSKIIRNYIEREQEMQK